MSGRKVGLVSLRGYSIFQQLQLEEALLRGTTQNWVLINNGAKAPAIVMGISGQPQELVHTDMVRKADVQLLKRFTGGGTVVVDANTLFVTFIFQADDLPAVECFPVPIMRWSEGFYKDVFEPHGKFRLRENDYVFNEHKFGGNAQAITRRRWLHHTSFLWDYDPALMALLKNPAKQPSYRQRRDHDSFITRLRDYVPCRDRLMESIMQRTYSLPLEVEEVSLEEASQALQHDYLRSNKQMELAATAP